MVLITVIVTINLRGLAGYAKATDRLPAINRLLSAEFSAGNELVIGYRRDIEGSRSTNGKLKSGRGLSASAINLRLTVLRGLVKKARRHGLIDWELDVANIAAENVHETSGPGMELLNRMLEAAKVQPGPCWAKVRLGEWKVTTPVIQQWPFVDRSDLSVLTIRLIPMPYYFQQINLPHLPPFEDNGNRWPTCVGKFIKPIVDATPGLKYWFSYYDSYFQLCFLTDDYATIRADMNLRMPPLGLTIRREPEAQDTLEGDCAMDKFYDCPEKNKTQRATLVLNYLHAVSALYIDQLIERADGKWLPEPNEDFGNNCDGEIFQSLLHMLCNMTQVHTPVFGFTFNGQQGLESSLVILNAGLQKEQRYNVHF